MLSIENFIAGAQIDLLILTILAMGDLMIRGPDSLVGRLVHRAFGWFDTDEEADKQ